MRPRTEYSALRASGRRSGFALLAVLIFVVALTASMLASVGAARESHAAHRNRWAGTRTRWMAEGCANAALARLVESLETSARAGGRAARRAWDDWDRWDVSASYAVHDCRIDWTSAGRRIDLDSADATSFGAALRGTALDARQRAALALALTCRCPGFSAREASNSQRPGAQYTRQSEHIATAYEHPLALLRVRGVELLAPSAQARLVDAFGVDEGPLNLATATSAALLGVSAFDDDAVAAVLAVRESGDIPTSLAEWLARLPSRGDSAARGSRGPPRGGLTDRILEWRVVARAHDPTTGITSAVELRLRHDGVRVAIAGQRRWFE